MAAGHLSAPEFPRANLRIEIDGRGRKSAVQGLRKISTCDIAVGQHNHMFNYNILKILVI